jgi:hypothetical protein
MTEQACYCCQRPGTLYSGGGTGARIVQRIVCEQCIAHRCFTHELGRAVSGKCRRHCPICVAENIKRLAAKTQRLAEQRKILDIPIDTERKVE